MVNMAKPPTHLSFLSTIVRGWHRLWARWMDNTKQWQFTGIQVMVHVLVITSSLKPKSASRDHTWTGTTLFQLQWRWRTRPKSWGGLEDTFHLIRWRYFILTHPAKSRHCKITGTELNWKRSHAFDITQTSSQFLFSFAFLSSRSCFFLLFIEQS